MQEETTNSRNGCLHATWRPARWPWWFLAFITCWMTCSGQRSFFLITNVDYIYVFFIQPHKGQSQTMNPHQPILHLQDWQTHTNKESLWHEPLWAPALVGSTHLHCISSPFVRLTLGQHLQWPRCQLSPPHHSKTLCQVVLVSLAHMSYLAIRHWQKSLFECSYSWQEAISKQMLWITKILWTPKLWKSINKHIEKVMWNAPPIICSLL